MRALEIPGPHGVLAAATIAATVLAATPLTATADTIYLVSGRVIHTNSARIEDGRVHFTQFGGGVSIPLDEVVRIVDNDKVERVTGAPPAGSGSPTEGAAGLRSATPATRPGDAPTPPTTGTAATLGNADSPDQPAYWIERILQVDERMARVQGELDRLPYYDETDERLLRFSGQARYFIAERERWETLMGQLELTRQRLLYGARKAGITPGSLRKGLRE